MNQIDILVLSVLICLFTACDETSRQRADREEKEQRQEAQQKREAKKAEAIAELRLTYNADDTWKQAFTHTPIWTIDLQDRLIRDAKRPIIATGILMDVKRRGTDYVFHFSQGVVEYFTDPPRVDFVLRCARFNENRGEVTETVEHFIETILLGISGDNYVFAARIDAVARRDKLIARVAGEQEAEIQVEDVPHFVASGECVAIRYIGQAGQEISQNPPPRNESELAREEEPKRLRGEEAKRLEKELRKELGLD